ncbi:MAG: DUF454 family protein [Gammaproteobacteria bacterium]|mgnify:FL=1|jgi:uncharacterized membrane protein YbaN (DUF454 family)|nr:DUF454 family protein [Gammaproteobacteria bacterium]MBT5202049.1 DUF454 family protein [Gammaproteobacteria bacterium]MBT5603059.1 DUF454 family protein [Gammaproteobacteria bacterium]MBT6245333.1 DUF454 family protein [Gammaproteobacteria bacterium]
MLAKLLYGVAGFILVLLGLFGLIMPVIPGVVFLFLAVICFARAFPDLQVWLDTNPTFRAVELKMRDGRQRCAKVLYAYRQLLVSEGTLLRNRKWLKVVPVLAAAMGHWLQTKWSKARY